MVLDIFDTELDISAELINELKKVLESDSSNSKTISFTSQRHIIAYQISLYTLSILNQFIKHVDKENLLDCLENSKLSSLNRKNLEVIYKSFHSLTNAMAIKNYSFAMRIINTLCQTITVSIALNEKDKRGNYSVFEAYLDEKKRTTFELNEGYSEIEYLEKFMDYFSDFDKRNFLNTPDFSEFDNSYHSWLYKYFLIKDPKHKFVKFQSPITESIKFITYQDVDKVITKGYQNYSLDFSSSYLTNNFGDFYFDSISPVTGGYEFPLIYDPFEDKGNFIPLINNMEIQCVHSIIDTINYLPYYFESIPSLVSLTVIFEKYIRIIFDEFYDSEELSYNSEKEAVEIIERESFNYMTRNKDTMVMKMILGKQKITSNKDKEVINKYFTNYKNNFLNNNDVSIKVIESSQIETSSVNLSIKYLNLFKSIENAYWYRAGDVIPSCLPLGEYEDRIDDLSDFDDKLIFVGGKESGRNEKFLTNIFFERKVMSFFNICNSLIIGDSLNALREVKKLYESIISNLYIVFKEFDEDGSKNNLDKLIPSLLIYIDNSFVNSHRGVDTWRDVRKIFSKIIIDNKDASNDMNNLSDDKLDELTANAFEELFENHELSNYIEEEEEESLKNLVFDEKELIKAMEGDDEGFKKYLNKFAQFKNSIDVDFNKKTKTKTRNDNMAKKDKEDELLAEETLLIDSLKESFPSFYEKILNTNITKNLCWISEKDINSINEVSKFLDSKIAITPILLDFDRIVANYFASMAPYFNDKEISDTELSLLVLDCAMLIVQTLEIDMRMISNSKIDILPILKTFTYILRNDITKLIKRVK